MSILHRSYVLICCTALLAACGSFNTNPEPTPEAATPPPTSTAPPTTSPLATVKTIHTPEMVTETPTASIMPQALVYLNKALDYIEKTAYMGDLVDWAELRRDAIDMAQGARTPADTYRAIRYAVQRLRDGHSFFWTPQAVKELEKRATDAPVPRIRLLENGIGYMDLPGFTGNKKQTVRYIASANEGMRRIDGSVTCGWMVDLRNNGGGNMWPMLASVGPILGQGDVGAFVYRDGRRQVWSYHDGRAMLDRQVLARGMEYRLARPRPLVALLTGRQTASSGEAMVVAFRGRAHTRSFGEPTYGIPTANDDKRLSDGAVLGVMTALDADRTGRIYDDQIAPDQPVSGSLAERSSKADPVMSSARAWMREQPGCNK